MIRKLKWKFVAIMMTIVTIMLIIIFAILFYSDVYKRQVVPYSYTKSRYSAMLF